MKTRRHHNNTGARQIKTGKTREQVKAMAKRLGVPYMAPEESRPSPDWDAEDKPGGCPRDDWDDPTLDAAIDAARGG